MTKITSHTFAEQVCPADLARKSARQVRLENVIAIFYWP